MTTKEHLAAIGQHARAIIRETLGAPRPASGASSPYDVFLTPNAFAINKARQEQLGSLGLDIDGKRVLEVGAGIGLHTPFFLERSCNVVVTDGNPENVEEIKRRHPTLTSRVIDMEVDASITDLGTFDLVYCYGLLYHLKNVERAIERLAEVCTGQIMLETCVSPGDHDEILFLRDFVSNNQAVSGIGCRPTRMWVMNRLKKYFGHAYITKTQPDHMDFPIDWDCPDTSLLYRSVFVGSKTPLRNSMLTGEIPRQQPKYRPA
jgi:2-polyprenyl-3-methyl-5-hydroxy-6-metoxy-1,4-benzoquinol methylase